MLSCSPRNQTQGGGRGRLQGTQGGGGVCGPTSRLGPCWPGFPRAQNQRSAWLRAGVRGGELCFKEPHTLRGPQGWSLQGWLAAGRPQEGLCLPKGKGGLFLLHPATDWMGPTAGWRVRNTEEISAGLCPQFPPRTYLIPCNFLGGKSVICLNEVSLGGLLGGSWSPE